MKQLLKPLLEKQTTRVLSLLSLEIKMITGQLAVVTGSMLVYFKQSQKAQRSHQSQHDYQHYSYSLVCGLSAHREAGC